MVAPSHKHKDHHKEEPYGHETNENIKSAGKTREEGMQNQGDDDDHSDSHNKALANTIAIAALEVDLATAAGHKGEERE
jgi:hypothetical protein